MSHFGINGILQNNAYILQYILNLYLAFLILFFKGSNQKLNFLRGALCQMFWTYSKKLTGPIIFWSKKIYNMELKKSYFYFNYKHIRAQGKQ